MQEKNNPGTGSLEKFDFAEAVAARLQEKYGFRFEKCFDLVLSSSAWSKYYSAPDSPEPDIGSFTEAVSKEIDNNDIF